LLKVAKVSILFLEPHVTRADLCSSLKRVAVFLPLELFKAASTVTIPQEEQFIGALKNVFVEVLEVGQWQSGGYGCWQVEESV
jgi:L-cysteine desulfidase